MKKLLIIVVVGVLLCALLGVRTFLVVRKQAQEKACPALAKICPDGSTVSMTGPNCAFAACPDTLNIPSVVDSDIDTLLPQMKSR